MISQGRLTDDVLYDRWSGLTATDDAPDPAASSARAPTRRAPRAAAARVILDGSPFQLRRLALPATVIGTGATVAALVNGKVGVWIGQTPSLLLLAALLGGAFFAVFAFLGALPVLLWPVLTTGGYLILYPRTHPVITFDRVWIGGMLAFLAVSPRPAARSRETRLVMGALVLLVLTYGVRAVSTDASVSGPVATWADAIVLPTILFVACERYCLKGAAHRRRLLAAVMIGGGVLASIGLAEKIWGFQLATLTGGSVRFDAVVDQTRISGPYPAPEPYALTLLVCFAATVWWTATRRDGRRRWGLAIAALQVLGISLALFRAAWIGALLVAVAALGIRPRRFGRLFGVSLVIGALALAGTSLLEQNRTFSTRATDTTNIYGRLATYEQGLEIFRHHPLFGIGVNNYHAYTERLPPVTLHGVESVTYPHSSYIGLLAEQGLLGFIPLVVLSFAIWRLVRTLTRSAHGRDELLLSATVTGAALAYLIMSMTLTMLPYEPSNAFFFVLLAVVSAAVDETASRSRPSSRLAVRAAPAHTSSRRARLSDS